jgi:hypothetical protein
MAAAALLLAVPITAVASNVGLNDEVVIHLALGTGFVLVAFAVFDFDVDSRINWMGCAAMAALAAIFYLQAVSKAVDNDLLHDVAFDILGQGLESALVDIFLIWCVAVLFTDSTGRTRIFGFVAITVVISTELYRYGLLLLGDEAPEILKISMVLPIIWLLLESAKSTSPSSGREVASLEPA